MVLGERLEFAVKEPVAYELVYLGAGELDI